MAIFNVVNGRTFRGGHLHEEGDRFVCADEEVRFHCDSVNLEPADAACAEAILAYAPDSKRAKRIIAERGAAKKAAEEDAVAKKKTAELAAKNAAEAEARAKAQK